MSMKQRIGQEFSCDSTAFHDSRARHNEPTGMKNPPPCIGVHPIRGFYKKGSSAFLRIVRSTVSVSTRPCSC